jgi:hypothetical protein
MKQETDKNLPAFRVLAMLALAALSVMGAHHAARAQAPTPTPLWIPTGTSISPINTGNVGIGTTAPSEKLHVPLRVRFGNLLLGETRSGGAVPNGETIEAFGHLVLLSQPGSDIRFGSPGAPARMTLHSAGNVGIGTASPVRPFHVDVGALTSSGMRVGRASAANNPYFDFMLDTGGTPYGFISVGDNLLYRNLVLAPFGGNVGVGVNDPQDRLDVGGNIRLRPNGYLNLFGTGGSNGLLRGHPSVPGVELGSLTAHPVWFITNSAERMRIDPGGNVGIGTTAPGYKLDVSGSVNASGLCIAGVCKTSWQQVGGGWTGSGSNLYFNTGSVGIGTTSPAFKLDSMGAIRGIGDGTVPVTNQYAFTGGGQQHYFDGGVPFAPLGRGGSFAYYGTSTGVGANPGGIFIGGFGSQSGGAAGVYAQGGDTHAEEYNRAWGGVGLFAQGGQNGPHTGGPYGWAYSRYAAAAFFNGYVQMGSNDGRASGLAVGFDGFNGYGAKLPPNGGMIVNGTVGVGTSTPSYKLDVQGGQLNASGGLCIAGDCRASWAQVAGGSSATQWSSGANGAISYSGGNVGVGTAAPSVKLHVSGTTLSGISAGNTADYPYRSLIVTTRPNNDGIADIGFDPNSTYRGALDFAGGNGSLAWFVNGGSGWSNPFLITGAGNVGIGTPAPGFKLDVQGGQINASGGLCMAGVCKATWAEVGGGGGASQWTTGTSGAIYYNSGRVGIGATNPAEMLELNGSGEVKVRAAGTISAGIQFRSTGTSTWSEWQQFFGRMRLNTHDGTTTRPDVMTILPDGKVGIGRDTPTEALDVVGNIKATGSVSATYQDVAEWVPSTQKLAAGTVVVLDADRTNHVSASASSYDTKVAGVVSEQPGIILGVGGEGKVKVATTGRVRVRVDASRGAIRVGDLLVTSGVEGVAMKSVEVDLGGVKIHRPGTIIGKALEPLEKGTGEILVLLSLQ